MDFDCDKILKAFGDEAYKFAGSPTRKIVCRMSGFSTLAEKRSAFVFALR